MEQLALWQATACGMNLANGLVVLTLRPAGKEMYDPYAMMSSARLKVCARPS
jgi:hypothetical protein